MLKSIESMIISDVGEISGKSVNKAKEPVKGSHFQRIIDQFQIKISQNRIKDEFQINIQCFILEFL